MVSYQVELRLYATSIHNESFWTTMPDAIAGLCEGGYWEVKAAALETSRIVPSRVIGQRSCKTLPSEDIPRLGMP